MQVSDLIADSGLSLELRTKRTPLDRAITGAHAIELPDPGRWISPGDVVLTTGVALGEDPEGLAGFVTSAAHAGAPALGFGEGVEFDRVPDAMVETAERLGFTIFAVPFEIPFRDIVAGILSDTLATGYRDLARASALQDFLLEAIEAPEPRDTVVDHLHKILELPVALFSPLGDPIASAGKCDLEALWTVAEPRAPLGRLGENYVVVADVIVDGEPRFVLAVHLVGAARLESFTRSLLGFATRVLQMIATTEIVVTSQERTARSLLLRQLLNAPEVTESLRAQAGTYGFRDGEPVQLMAISSQSSAGQHSTDDLSQLQSLVETVLARMRVPRMTSADVDAGQLIAVVQGEDLPTRFADAHGGLLAPEPLDVGVGLPAPGLEELEQGLREARVALDAARQRRRRPLRLALFDELDFSSLLLAYLPPSRRTAIVDVLEPIADREDLIETLTAFFEHGSDVAETATSLHLHANSIRYRLSRIQDALGVDLKNQRALTAVYLALQARQVFGDSFKSD